MRTLISHGTMVALIAAAILSMSLQPSAAAEAEPVDASAAAALADAEMQLRAMGIDPGSAVVQVGALNYAGPDCPGSEWNCTTAMTVIQIGSGNSHAQNVSNCSQPPGSQNPCVIVQPGPGDNKAHCFMKYTSPPIAQDLAPASESADQTCVISQNSVGGTNEAVMVLEVDQNTGSMQTANQLASIRQVNSTGTNKLQIVEKIKQASDQVNGGITQTQTATQVACVDQSAVGGHNISQVDQALGQHAQAGSVAAIVQNQNASPPLVLTNNQFCQIPTVGNLGVFGNTRAGITQSAQGGSSQSQLTQSHDLDAAANTRPTDPLSFAAITQKQGDALGGLYGAVVQTGSGIARSNAQQSEDQSVQAQTEGAVTQTQIGPEFCCTEQLGSNPNNAVAIAQRSSQSSDGEEEETDTVSQTTTVNGLCATQGKCTIQQTGSNDFDSDSNSCEAEGEACASQVTCTSAFESSSENACSSPEPVVSPIEEGEIN